jgi:hypothetical protein
MEEPGLLYHMHKVPLWELFLRQHHLPVHKHRKFSRLLLYHNHTHNNNSDLIRFEYHLYKLTMNYKNLCPSMVYMVEVEVEVVEEVVEGA